MKTKIAGYTKSSVCITTDGELDVIKCENSLMRLWLSSGTILNLELDKKLFQDIWKIRVLYGPVDKNYVHKQCLFNSTWDPRESSDVFETDEEVIHYRIIPCSWLYPGYKGEN